MNATKAFIVIGGLIVLFIGLIYLAETSQQDHCFEKTGSKACYGRGIY